MNPKLKVFKDKYFDYSMIRWGAVGIFTTAVDYLLFVNLYGPINSVFIANLLSSAVATSINYFKSDTFASPVFLPNQNPDGCALSRNNWL